MIIIFKCFYGTPKIKESYATFITYLPFKWALASLALTRLAFVRPKDASVFMKRTNERILC